MNIIKKVLYFIINPFSTFGIGKASDNVSKVMNKKSYLIYLLAFVITVIIIYLHYFL